MSIEFNVTVEGEERSRTALKRVQTAINSRLREAIQRAALDLLGYVKSRKLTGQVLNVRTGRLRRSITQRVETESNGTIVGLVGTNVSYGRVHEFGYKGSQSVRAHTRKIGGRRVPVRAHSRQMDIPKRPFLGPSLNEKMPVYRQWINNAIQGAVNASGA